MLTTNGIEYLVGGLEHEFIFSIYWECHHPNCYSLHHFSEGLWSISDGYRGFKDGMVFPQEMVVELKFGVRDKVGKERQSI